jgi:hypothetical protein
MEEAEALLGRGRGEPNKSCIAGERGVVVPGLLSRLLLDPLWAMCSF